MCAEPGSDKIMADGIGRFCEDLNLDPASLKVLIIAWKFKAATQCEFTKKEFSDGMAELGCVEPSLKWAIETVKPPIKKEDDHQGLVYAA